MNVNSTACPSARFVREYLSLVPRVKDACNDVGFGWVLTKASTGEVCLMKPFSSARIQLPNFKNFPGYSKIKTNPEALFISRAWLTANPSETSDFCLLIDGHQYSGFWKNGDENWTKMETLSCYNITCCKGKVYVLDLEGHVLVWDSQDFRRISVKNAPTYFASAWQDYLVGTSDSELLMIRRNNTGIAAYVDTGVDHFDVMRVDLVKGELTEINGLGKDAVFLGDNAAVAVDATEFLGILKPNCIYFTDDRAVNYRYKRCPNGGGKDMGIYNVEDGSIERFGVESFSKVCPPLWVFPSF